jgi:glycosyltransferase involved in cell wall biosynthesis
MTKNFGLVSVIIPVYNCEKYLAEAITSVLTQTYQNLEIIVVDDGSTDGSAEVAKSFGSSVRYYFHTNRGLGATRNRGMELIKGDFFAFLDADDIWLENKLIHQLEFLQNNPEVNLVFGLTQQFISPELDEIIKSRIDCPPQPMSGYIPSALLGTKNAWMRAGKFDTNWKLGEFIDWYAKTMEIGLKSYMLPEIVFKRRLHTTNMGIRERQHRVDYIHILKASLDRRRSKDSLS